MSQSTTARADAAPAHEPEDHNPIAAPSTRRLLPSIGLSSFALFAAINGLMLVVLPAQVAGLDEANKVTNLAIVNLVTLVFTVITQPIVGTFSDRTRSRLGRRAPWMLGAAILAFGALLTIGQLQVLGIVIVFWALAQIGIQAVQAPLTAVIPDRYARAKRGLPSSMLGFGTLIGAGMGVVIAGSVVTNPAIGYSIFGIAILVTTVLFVLINRDRSSVDMVNPPFNLKAFVKGFWVSPRQYPDFAWAFTARAIFYIGFFSSFAVQLYILTDYVGLSLEKAGVQIGLNQAAALPFMVVSVITSGWISDRIKRRKVFIYLANAMVFVGLGVPIFMPTVTGSLISLIILGTAFGLYLSADTALLTEVLPNNGEAAAKDLGILNIATVLPQALASGVAALILAIFGNPAGYIPLFIFGMICAVLGAITLIPVKSVK